ncbi:MAG: hypothetical protein SGJ19_08720 [Planctomycetia bacterium]|nr:hypothetical protein [Planctomycetia bacterium]
MPWVIGTDEAGYGPNLGPLVIGATVWHYGGSLPLDEALATLARAVGPAADRTVAIADSKQLYSPGVGLARLESCLLAALAACGVSPFDARDVWTQLAPAALIALDAETMYAAPHARWPVACQPDDIDARRQELSAILETHGWRLVSVNCRALFPREFNAEVRRLGNKAHVLSQATLQLAAQALAQTSDDDVLICCDKHGGRNHYTGVLQHCFADGWITPRCEGAALSAYDCRLANRNVRIEFRARGECQPPTALASMAAKYLRELAMHAFNAFWSGHVKDLRPTAGYPGDAARFHEQVLAAREKLGIEVEAFWRER